MAELKLEHASALATHRVPDGHYVDSEGILEKQMHTARVNGVLIRPDRFIFGGDRELTPDDYRRVAEVVIPEHARARRVE